jgi:hypothetical protein
MNGCRKASVVLLMTKRRHMMEDKKLKMDLGVFIG